MNRYKINRYKINRYKMNRYKINRYKINRKNRQKILLITYNSSNREYPKHRYRLKNKPIKLNSRINNNN